MSTAEQKKNENIIEYLLYVWQMEDMLRALKFDLDAVENVLKVQYDEDRLDEEISWFEELGKAMHMEKLEKKGHITEVLELMNELSYLHITLLNVFQDTQYIKAHEAAKPELEAFVKKSGQEFNNIIEPGLIALYGLLTLRLRKVDISEETMKSMESIQFLFAIMADRYNKMKKGELTISSN
ncbi:MAG: DUF4924 family protein [Flavobacteriales bacterium]|nr:DUF4924 family protein [Flavobacteriales bacterium]